VPQAKAGAKPPPPPGLAPRAGLEEAAALWWRPEVTQRELVRRGRRWTLWTTWIAIVFAIPGVVLLLLSPLTLPVALGCFAHAWLVPRLQARRGARAVAPLGDSCGGAHGVADAEANRVALGLLGDLVGHAQRDRLAAAGLVLERGRLGVWLIGERGALLVRPGGRRVDSWCVRVGEPEGLPPADRAANLLLALREDEAGFAKVGNLGFSGAPWRVRWGLPERCRPALAAAQRMARSAERPLSREALVPIDGL
jgi:hypothetical protein